MAPTKLPADDLFEKSSMSFGEHLEELRKSLLKAFIWLGIGTAIGLLFAENIVKFIETPLKESIANFYVKKAKGDYKDANGVEPSDELAAWIVKHRMMPEPVYIDPDELLARSTGAKIATTTVEADAASENDDGAKTLRSEETQKTAPGEKQSSPAALDPGDEDSGKVAPEAKSPGESEAEAQATDSNDPVENRAEEDKQAASTKTAGVVGAAFQSDEIAKKTTEAVAEEELDGVLSSDVNPWQGVDIEQLLRLEPLLIWRPIPNKLVSLTATEPFMMWLKAGLVAGVVIGSPGIFWHVWQFFAAGLYPHERRYVYWYLPLSLALFLSGVCLAFFVVFELVLSFLMNYTTGLDVEFTPRLNDYMTFALFLPLGFGVAFQLPIVMLGLHRFGVVSADTYVSQWRMAVLVIAFMSMVFTPAEVYSMMGLFIPLVGLYFFGIALCKYMPHGAGIGSQQIDPQG